jgi:hypothetical protein
MEKKGKDFGEDIAQTNCSGEGRALSWVTSFSRKDLVKHSSGMVSQKRFINAINYIHFSEGTIFLHAGDQENAEEYLVRIYPEPCQGPEVKCWFPQGFRDNVKELSLRNLIIDDGKSILCMPIDILETEDLFFCAKMKSKCFAFSDRNARRFNSLLVDAVVRQEERIGAGNLVDFNPHGFRIDFEDDNADSFETAKSVSIELFRGKTKIYSGMCRIVRKDKKANFIVLAPNEDQRRIYKKRKLRNPRVNLVPTPRIIFSHPLSNKDVSYEISDITPTGFSVYEDADQAVLIPGMIIHDMTILYAGGFKLTCDAQVIYSRKKNKNIKQFGCAIIDMDIVTYNKLFEIISKASDVHANVSREVNMASLWEFFFETGFIYPKKYAILSENKDIFKNTYKLLYQNSPELFANFTYQRNGTIYGHVSIIKAYQRSWMIHHLAAKPMGKRRTGLYVLNHILNYFDGLYRMPTIGMDYMIFYFRPDNKFPDYFFGGFCRELNDPKGCSMDQFAYISSPINAQKEIPDGWEISRCADKDIENLSQWYDRTSGGLMIKAFCLTRDTQGGELLEDAYARANLKRSYSLAKLSRAGKAKAYFLIDQSDNGLNLSDLLNSIKVIVTDKDELSKDILLSAIGSLEKAYKIKKAPILINPVSYADETGIGYEKRYNLWVLNSQCGDDYSEHLKQKAKFNIGKFIIAYLASKFAKK